MNKPPFCWWCGHPLSKTRQGEERIAAVVEGHRVHMCCEEAALQTLHHLTACPPPEMGESDKIISSKKPDADHQ